MKPLDSALTHLREAVIDLRAAALKHEDYTERLLAILEAETQGVIDGCERTVTEITAQKKRLLKR